MNRSIALAYAITGLAVAAAIITIVGVTSGLFDAGSRTDPVAALATPAAAPSVAAPVGPAPAVAAAAVPETDPTGGVAPAATVGPEVVTVEMPLGRKHQRPEHRHDDDDDDEQGERDDD